MVKVILGLKGSGKTKKIVDLIHEALKSEHGNVVCIERKKNLTYDIPHQVRLIDASDYPFGGTDFMKGFLSGLRSGNYDITHIFIDNFHKLFSGDEAEVIAFLDWLHVFSEKETVRFTISMSLDPETASPEITKYM